LALTLSTPLSSSLVASRAIDAEIDDHPIGSVQLDPSLQSIKNEETATFTVQVSRSKLGHSQQAPFSVVLSLVGDPNLKKQLEQKMLFL
jgi:hypothetical protein